MFNDQSNMLRLLLTRRSAKARDLVEPGPDKDELDKILSAGMRVPDHGKIAPWRFVVFDTKAIQAKFGDRLAALYAAEKSDASRLERETMRDFPQQAPVMVAVVSRPNLERSIPLWEQQLSAGVATYNMLLAAIASGYGASWLTGWAAYSDAVVRELGGDAGSAVAGFLFIGTPGKALKERPRPEFDEIVSYWGA